MGSRRVCIANQRASVGKSATAVNFACGLAAAGQATLLVDLDAKCTATTGLGASPRDRHPLISGRPLRDVVVRGQAGSPDLVPGSANLDDLEVLRTGETEACQKLADKIVAGGATYDWVLFDCPSSIGRITEIGLLAATEIMVPIQCEYFALEGTPQLIQIIKKAMQRRSGELEFAGILLTMHEDSLELTRGVDKEVREFFGEIVFETVIPRDRAFSNLSAGQLSVVKHSPRTRAARAYVELCMEVLDRE